MDYFGARYYGSALGRFISPDLKSPDLSFRLNPQKWNRYSYAGNNPLVNVDNDGRDWAKVWEDLKTAGANLYATASVGFGYGARAKVGPVKAEAEVAIKANLKASNPALSLTTLLVRRWSFSRARECEGWRGGFLSRRPQQVSILIQVIYLLA